MNLIQQKLLLAKRTIFVFLTPIGSSFKMISFIELWIRRLKVIKLSKKRFPLIEFFLGN